MASTDSQEESTSTRIITNRQVVHQGVTFHWWAVGDDPALVTISNSVFGSLQEFTHGDRIAFALSLAKKLLNEHYARAERQKTEQKAADDELSALDMAGWYESPPDFPS